MTAVTSRRDLPRRWWRHRRGTESPGATTTKETNTLRKISLGLVATAVVAAPLTLAGSANAATTPNGGTVFLSKSTLQSTLHLNNAGFDALKASDFKATGTLLAVQQAHFVCDGAEVSSYDWPTAYADAVT